MPAQGDPAGPADSDADGVKAAQSSEIPNSNDETLVPNQALQQVPRAKGHCGTQAPEADSGKDCSAVPGDKASP